MLLICIYSFYSVLTNQPCLWGVYHTYFLKMQPQNLLLIYKHIKKMRFQPQKMLLIVFYSFTQFETIIVFLILHPWHHPGPFPIIRVCLVYILAQFVKLFQNPSKNRQTFPSQMCAYSEKYLLLTLYLLFIAFRVHHSSSELL